MPRLPLIDPANATGPAKPLLDAVGKKLGLVPNMTRAMANSPAVLKAYLEFSGALAGASLSAKTRELVWSSWICSKSREGRSRDRLSRNRYSGKWQPFVFGGYRHDTSGKYPKSSAGDFQLP